MSEQQHHARRATDHGGNWNIQRKDAVYAAVLALTVGGQQVIDHNRAASPPDLTSINASIERLDKSLNELRDPGGPKLRETVLRVQNLETQNTTQQAAIDAINAARFNELKNGVSQETITDLRNRLNDDRETQKDLKAQVEALRTAIDSLRSEIIRATSMRLQGPAR